MKRTLVSLFALVSAMTFQCLADSASKSVTVKFFVDDDEYFFRAGKSTREFLLNERYDFKNPNEDSGQGLPSHIS